MHCIIAEKTIALVNVEVPGLSVAGGRLMEVEREEPQHITVSTMSPIHVSGHIFELRQCSEKKTCENAHCKKQKKAFFFI